MLSLWEDQVCHQIKTNDKSEKLRSPLKKVVTLVRCGKATEQHTTGLPETHLTWLLFRGQQLFLQVVYLDSLWREGAQSLSMESLSMKTPLNLAWNDAWKRETIGRQLLWVSSLLLSQRPHCYSPVKWRKWGKGTGAGAAAASGLSVLPGSRHTFPFPTGPLKTGGAEHIYLCMRREKEIALIELGIICQSNYRLMKWRKWGNTHFEVDE